MTKAQDTWLAGLLEGEGTFCPHRTKRKRKYGTYIASQVRVQIQMCDRDVMERVAKLFGSNLLGPYEGKGRGFSEINRLPFWVVSAVGQKAKRVIKLVRPYMGERRKKQILDMLKEEGSWRE